LSAYRSIKSNKQKLDKPPEKKKLSIRLDKRTYSYKNGVFSIISLEKRVKCQPYIYPKLQELISKYRFCDPLLFEKNGEIWICLTFDIPEILSQNKLACGIDLGCRVNAATSEGNLYIDKKFNGEKRKLRFNKRKLQSKSKNSKSAKRHLKKLKRKEANKNKNFSHHLANKLIKDTKADTLVLENLKSLKVKKNKYENKNRISQVPIYQLKQFLTYKALLNEKTVIEVCPSYTSQIDSQTDKKDGVRKGRRYYSKSGKIYDSDVNGAINIGLRSKLPISLSPQGIGTYGQANVNSPIVGVGRSQATIPLG
jgi:IS605 OrfB family transposase